MFTIDPTTIIMGTIISDHLHHTLGYIPNGPNRYGPSPSPSSVVHSRNHRFRCRYSSLNSNSNVFVLFVVVIILLFQLTTVLTLSTSFTTNPTTTTANAASFLTKDLAAPSSIASTTLPSTGVESNGSSGSHPNSHHNSKSQHHSHHNPHYPTLPNGSQAQSHPNHHSHLHQHHHHHRPAHTPQPQTSGQILDLSQHPFLPPDLQPLTPPPPSTVQVAPPHQPTSDQTNNAGDQSQPELPLLPPSGGSAIISEAEMAGTNPKGLKFEEEPLDSYIVRSKSALLRCKTLNALNAWFTCNSGDERRIHSNQKLSNYVDPQTGIRMIEIDLEVSRSDVEEHHNSGYTTPFECWCTAYGGQHQIMSRKASVSFSYLKKHFHIEPEARRVKLGTSQLSLSCLPPDGHPKPTIFWMKNDVIIVENGPNGAHQPRSISGTVPNHPNNSSNHNNNVTSVTAKPAKLSTNQRKIFAAKKLGKFPTKIKDSLKFRSKRNNKVELANLIESKKKVPEESDDDDEDYDEDIEIEGIRMDEDDEEEEDDVDNEKSSRKDSEDLIPETFDDLMFLNNYQMGGDNSLIIKQVSLTDQANYTCGVRNAAGVRFSNLALVTVYVNGEWSSWGSWSSCHLPTGAKCGHGTQKRTRHCSNPAPVNSGQLCQGDSSQVSECNILCSPVDGFWSPWSVWSTCSHECSQVRRRVCNNPTPEFGGNDCFGPDFLIKNCTGGMCRKGLAGPGGGGGGPSVMNNGFDLSSQDSQSSSNEQVYFLIIFVLTLIIVVFILYIALRFNRRQRRYGKKSSSASSSGTNAVLAGLHHHGAWTDIELERSHNAGMFGTASIGGHHRMSSEDDGQATMLLLLQQQQQQNQQQLINSGLPMSSPLPPPHSHLHRNNVLNGRLLQQQQSGTNNGILIPEKYQLVTRLNNNGTNNNVVDHFVVRYDAGVSPGLHQQSNGTLSSISTNSTTNNKYEEPIFNVRSPHHHNQQAASAAVNPLNLHQQHTQHSNVPLPPAPLPPHLIHHHQPPPLPQPNIHPTVPVGTRDHSTGTNSSGTTVTTATVTTTSSSELSSEPSHIDPESEPDYAEPIVELTTAAAANSSDFGPTGSVVNYHRGGGANNNNSSAHYRYHQHGAPLMPTISTSVASSPAPHRPKLHHHHPNTTGYPNDNQSEIAAKLLGGKHEKFIKLTPDLIKLGHYSAMPNLGVGLYVTPNLLLTLPNKNLRHQHSDPKSSSTSSSGDLYLRYGIDTGTRISGGQICPLSPVITVNFSRPTTEMPLSRPFVLVFRHCIHLRNSELENNLTVLWQECDILQPSTVNGVPSVGNHASDKWIEILRYGQENLNTACYLHCDSSHCYLVTNFVGKYLLCLNNNKHKMALTNESSNDYYYSNCNNNYLETNSNDSYSNNDSLALLPSGHAHSNQQQQAQAQSGATSQLLRELDFVKLLNFSLLIEPIIASGSKSQRCGQNRIKVFIYDHLPSSIVQLAGKVSSSPAGGSTSSSTQNYSMLRLGEQSCTTLRLSAKAGGSVYFELKLPTTSSSGANHRSSARTSVKRVEIPVSELWNCGPNWMMNCTFEGTDGGQMMIDFCDEDHDIKEDIKDEDYEEDDEDFVYDDDQDYDDHDDEDLDEDLDDLELNYEVKIWQSRSSLPKSTTIDSSNSHNKMSYHSNIVILNRSSLKRLTKQKQQSNGQHRTSISRSIRTSRFASRYRYREQWLQLFHPGTKDLQIRTLLMHHLDQPRSDQLDWRQFAAAGKFDRYLPYFASQSSPTGQIFELWEARVLNEFLLAKVMATTPSRNNGNGEYGAISCSGSGSSSSSPATNAPSGGASNSNSVLKEFYYSKLVHLLQTIKRNDLIEIILQHQC